MTDCGEQIFRSWVETNVRAGLELAEASDLLSLVPVGATRLIAHFEGPCLTRGAAGAVDVAHGFDVGIRLPRGFLADPHAHESSQLVCYLGPHDNVFHPNIRGHAICMNVGGPTHLLPRLLHAIWDLFLGVHSSADPLDPDAAAWYREHPERFPLSRTPLKRRRLEIRVARKS